MRKLLLTVVAVALLTTTAAAYEKGYVGLFADETRSSWCFEAAVYPFAFDVWVYCLPSENGVRAAEFSLGELPPDYFLTGTAPGPAISVTMGDVLYGISYSTYLCQTDWFLLDIYSMVATASGQASIWIDGHGDTGLISLANCLAGHPIEDAYVYTSIFVNHPLDSPECTGVGTEESSWGAIKNMYGR